MTPAARRGLWLAGWLLAAALIYLLARDLDVATLSAALDRANTAWLVASMVVYATLQPVGALQWRCLLPRGRGIPWKRLVTLFSVTSVANNTTPSIIGHATGTALIAAEPGVGPAAAMSVLALDQLAVGVSKLVVLIATVSLVDAPAWLKTGTWSLAAAVALLGVGMWIAERQSARLVAWSATRRGLVGRVLDFLARWATHLNALREPRRFGAGIACAIAMRSLEGLAILAVMTAFGLDPTLPAVLAVLAATSLATVIPFSPAGLGTYEAGAYAAFRFVGHTPETSLAAAVILHACGLVPAVGIGYVVLTVRRRI